jgi:hypothetical protein
VNAETLADQDQAVTVPCGESRCNALIGERCVNIHTGEPLLKQAAHLSRLKAAGVVHAPIPTSELRRGD